MHAFLVALALAATSGPRFIEDDYAKALKQAKAQKKLLFVDAWAPWCHSCLAMKEHVLSKPALLDFEKDVVFASIDTEKAKAAGFLGRFPIEVWPTLLFIDPATEKPVLKWLGTADEAQLKGLLEAARGGPGVLRDADDALARGNWGDAAQKYRAALDAGDGKPRTALAMLSALYLSKQHEACARTALEQLPLFTAPQERVAALTWALGCAVELPEGKTRTSTLDVLVVEGTKGLKLQGVLPDDVSGLYEALVLEREAAKDTDGAVALAKQWLAFLEGEAGKASTPAARAVFDPHRVAAALSSKQPQAVLPALLQSEKELAKDYNPPARLALVYRELGQLDDALKAADRALGKCKEGPRKLRLYENKASILEKKGDAAGRQKVLAEAVKFAKKLPKAQVSEQRVAALEALLQGSK